jgi:outer membrane protein OmpA-like peptidoglycan-associated protein
MTPNTVCLPKIVSRDDRACRHPCGRLAIARGRPDLRSHGAPYSDPRRRGLPERESVAPQVRFAAKQRLMDDRKKKAAKPGRKACRSPLLLRVNALREGAAMFRMIPLLAGAVAIGLGSAGARDSDWKTPIIAVSKAASDSPSAVSGKTFIVFFNLDGTSLTEEGYQIVSAAAKQFIEGHSAGAKMFVISSSTDPRNAILSTKRTVAVASELVRDGVSAKSINTSWSSPDRNMPISIREWQNRRLLIAIRPNLPSTGRPLEGEPS